MHLGVICASTAKVLKIQTKLEEFFLYIFIAKRMANASNRVIKKNCVTH